MAHEVVYGICEDKCKERVIPMSYVTSMAVDVSVRAGSGIVLKSVSYPNGKSAYNTAVADVNLSQYSNAGKTKERVGAYSTADGSIREIVVVELQEDKIQIYVDTSLLNGRTDKVTVWLKLLRCS